MPQFLRHSTLLPPKPIHWSWVSLSGPDAKDFLQRLTTVNLKTLEVGEHSAGCFLTPLGKIRVSFTLWCLKEGEYAFEFDAGTHDFWKKELLSAIDQFTFSEKMAVKDHSEDWAWSWIWLDSNENSDFEARFELKSGQTQLLESQVRACHRGDSDFGKNWITLWGPDYSLQSWLKKTFPHEESLSYEQFETQRILHLTPWIDCEITNASNPLEVGLKNSIAENKGCYPGQEVIEKIISLGSPARRLVQIKGKGQCPAASDSIHPSDSPQLEVGKITSAIPLDQDEFIALGIVRKTHTKEGLEVIFANHGKDHSQGNLVKVISYSSQT